MVPAWVRRPRFEDGDVVGESERVDRVVGDEEGGAGEGGEVPAEVATDVDPGAGVEGREWFVEQQRGRVGGKRPSEGNPLRLTARERAGLGIGLGGDADLGEQVGGDGTGLACGAALRPRSEGDVVERRQVREQQMVLVDDAEAATLLGNEGGRRPVEGDPVEVDGAGVDGEAAGDRSQQCGLAGTVRSEHRGDRSRRGAQLDLQVEVSEPDRDVGVEGHARVSHRSRRATSTTSETTSSTRLSAMAASWSLSSSR